MAKITKHRKTWTWFSVRNGKLVVNKGHIPKWDANYFVVEGRKGKLAFPKKIGYPDVAYISKMTKKYAEEKHPDFKWRVQSKKFTGGQSLTIIIMPGSKKVFRDVDKIPDDEIIRSMMRRGIRLPSGEVPESEIKKYRERLKRGIEYSKRYGYQIGNPDDDILLTPEAKKSLKDVNDFANRWNWDRSDIMTDYFDVGYYVSLEAMDK